jgi:hypothetical protein
VYETSARIWDSIICVRANVRRANCSDSSVPVRLSRGSPYRPEQIVLLPGFVDDVRWDYADQPADPACTNRENVSTAGLRNFTAERRKWNAKQMEDGVTERH